MRELGLLNSSVHKKQSEVIKLHIVQIADLYLAYGSMLCESIVWIEEKEKIFRTRSIRKGEMMKVALYYYGTFIPFICVLWYCTKRAELEILEISFGHFDKKTPPTTNNTVWFCGYHLDLLVTHYNHEAISFLLSPHLILFSHSPSVVSEKELSKVAPGLE